jgi:hypothetical protein
MFRTRVTLPYIQWSDPTGRSVHIPSQKRAATKQAAADVQLAVGQSTHPCASDSTNVRGMSHCLALVRTDVSEEISPPLSE